jgi:hypothetical protein
VIYLHAANQTQLMVNHRSSWSANVSLVRPCSWCLFHHLQAAARRKDELPQASPPPRCKLGLWTSACLRLVLRHSLRRAEPSRAHLNSSRCGRSRQIFLACLSALPWVIAGSTCNKMETEMQVSVTKRMQGWCFGLSSNDVESQGSAFLN